MVRLRILEFDDVAGAVLAAVLGTNRFVFLGDFLDECILARLTQ